MVPSSPHHQKKGGRLSPAREEEGEALIRCMRGCCPNPSELLAYLRVPGVLALPVLATELVTVLPSLPRAATRK